MSFWIIFCLFGLMVIPCIVMFVIGGADIQHKIGGAIVCVIIWFIVSGGLYFQETSNAEKWDNGFCECGAHWELEAVTKSKCGTEIKYYSCSECYKEIEIIR